MSYILPVVFTSSGWIALLAFFIQLKRKDLLNYFKELQNWLLLTLDFLSCVTRGPSSAERRGFLVQVTTRSDGYSFPLGTCRTDRTVLWLYSKDTLQSTECLNQTQPFIPSLYICIAAGWAQNFARKGGSTFCAPTYKLHELQSTDHGKILYYILYYGGIYIPPPWSGAGPWKRWMTAFTIFTFECLGFFISFRGSGW